MAAMSSFLLRRSSSSALHLQNRLLSSRFLPFSTSSENDLVTQVEFVIEKTTPLPSRRDEPYLPIPDGFPFSVSGLKFAREDKDEKTEIWVNTNSYQLTNGNPSFDVDVRILRGYWSMKLEMVVGYKTMSIQKAEISEKRYQHVRCFEEFLDSKGIDARKIANLFNLYRKKGQRIC